MTCPKCDGDGQDCGICGTPSEQAAKMMEAAAKDIRDGALGSYLQLTDAITAVETVWEDTPDPAGGI